MGKGLALLGISCVLLVVLLFINNNPTIETAIMCGNVEKKMPVDVRDTFFLDDWGATLFLKLRDVKGTHMIRTVFTSPEGKEHYVDARHTHHKKLAKYVPWWSYIYIKDNIENIVPGTWQVDVYIDEENALTQNFVIRGRW
jgi:hypothetical protein